MPVIPIALAEVSRLSGDNKGIISLPLSHTSFTFDSFGVAGFFGGDSSISAMSSVTLIAERRWLGWYNAPGSLEVAKQYAQLGALLISETLSRTVAHRIVDHFILRHIDMAEYRKQRRR